jgi:hypothetical protein
MMGEFRKRFFMWLGVMVFVAPAVASAGWQTSELCVLESAAGTTVYVGRSRDAFSLPLPKPPATITIDGTIYSLGETSIPASELPAGTKCWKCPTAPANATFYRSVTAVFPSGVHDIRFDANAFMDRLSCNFSLEFMTKFGTGPCMDFDADGLCDYENDNCKSVANADQTDTDGDAQGDACDPDDDNDSVVDTSDNCPLTSNVDQANNELDSQGDVCDSDDDNDGVADGSDNCAVAANSSQSDVDADGQGDVCDGDDDSDGILDAADNCPSIPNDQTDLDGDGEGDACDLDDDNDEVPDSVDNCATIPNNQSDVDNDMLGDACDADDDNDSVSDASDNCQFVANTSQVNFDGDAQGDACDADDDNDGLSDGADVCGGTASGSLYLDPTTGCSLAQLCPCASPRGASVPWTNHGQYVSCVARSSQSLVTLGVMTEQQKGAASAAAGQSSCGNR